MDGLVIYCGSKLRKTKQDFCLHDKAQPRDTCCGILANAIVIHRDFHLTQDGLTYLLSRLRRYDEYYPKIADTVSIVNNHDQEFFIIINNNTGEKRIFDYEDCWESDQYLRLFEDIYDYILEVLGDFK